MHIYFIGIGGIGVSALARLYLHAGARVSGSDLVESDITLRLRQEGASVEVGTHQAGRLPEGIGLVVYTAAVAKTNPELLDAKRRGIKAVTYAAALGPITKRYKTITVSGSHGKSTTTAMTALVLEAGYFDPLVIVGTRMKEFGDSNFRPGRGGYFVFEADEYNKSFLKYAPTIAIVTNIDAEHLDTYKTVEGVEAAFEKYLSKVPPYGVIIANRDNERLRRVAERFGDRVRWYSLEDPESVIVRRILRVPGNHNVSNALAALHAGRALGIHDPSILFALSRFEGTWRRFEFKGFMDGAVVINDYGHHPREIHATLHAARERFPMRRIRCVFQPHHYERLHALWEEFLGAFDLADDIVLLPVYEVAGRERKRTRIAQKNSELLALALAARARSVTYIPHREDVKDVMMRTNRAGDVILLMGAGDIYLLADELVQTRKVDADLLEGSDI